MSIFLFLIILVVLIVVHEFGHFIVAKRAGIRVDEFGIGFPPRALTMFKKGETNYTLNWLPIGGFVKIFGENPDDLSAVSDQAQAGESISGPDRARSFVHKPKWIQALVLVAGVGFNVLLAWFLFIVVFAAGSATAVTPETDTTYITGSELRIVSVLSDSPAESAGIEAGDAVTLLSAGGETLTEPTPESIMQFVSSHPDEAITIELLRDGEAITNVITPVAGLIETDPSQPALGVGMSLVGELQLPIHLAIWEATLLTGDMLVAIVIALGAFFASAFTLTADLSQITGPVGIVGLVGDAASFGFVSLLMFTAFISLNLAIINLLPIPALDGGRLLFVLIEALKGSPINPRFANAVNTAGFAFLILLMIAVTYNDVLKLVS